MRSFFLKETKTVNSIEKFGTRYSRHVHQCVEPRPVLFLNTAAA